MAKRQISYVPESVGKERFQLIFTKTPASLPQSLPQEQ